MKNFNPKYVEALMAAINTSPYQVHNNLTLTKMEPGHCEMEAILQPEIQGNVYGGVHGGFYGQLVDASTFWSTYLYVEEGDGFTTVNMDVHDTGALPVCEGKILVKGDVVKAGRTICLAECHAYSEAGKLLVYGSASMMILHGVENDVHKVFERSGIEEPSPRYL